MRSSVLVVVLVTRLVAGIQFYSHLPLVGETYVRHVKGRIRRSEIRVNDAVPVQDNNLYRKRRESSNAASKHSQDEFTNVDASTDSDTNPNDISTNIDLITRTNVTEELGTIISAGFKLQKDFEFPENMVFVFNVEGEKLRLNLKLNRKQTAHAPVRLLRDGHFSEYNCTARRDYAFYQMMDDSPGADVMVRCDTFQPPCYLVGRFAHGGLDYAIEPTEHTPRLQHNVLHSIRTMPVYVDEDNRHDILTSSYSDYIISGDEETDEIYRDEREQTTQQIQYEVELEMVIGYSIWTYWLKQRDDDEDATVDTIQMYYELVINGVDAQYRNARTPKMAVTVSPLEILIVTTVDDEPWIQKNYFKLANGKQAVDIGNALDVAEQWVYRHTFNKPFDAIMFFSKEELVHVGKHDTVETTTGLARLLSYGETHDTARPYSLLCLDSESAISIVEDGPYNCISRTCAHELAHNMGVEHDDETKCGGDSNYLMSSISHPAVPRSQAENPWKFSPCSIAAMEDTLTRNYHDETIPRCLNEKVSDTVLENSEPLRSPQLGEKYTLDAQCALRFGPQSKACKHVGADLQDDVCYSGIPCQVTGPACSRYGFIAAFLGSPCGSGKWCDRGNCVTKQKDSETSTESAPPVPVSKVKGTSESMDFDLDCVSETRLEREVKEYEVGMEAENPGYDFTCTHNGCSRIMCHGICVLPTGCEHS